MKRQWVIYLFRSMAMALGLATLFAFFDTTYWLLELFAHFTVQYIALSLLLLPIAILYKRWRMTAILVLVLFIHSLELWQVATQLSQKRVPCEGSTVSILQSNVYYRNWMIPEASRALQKAAERADIVILNEFSEIWRAQEEERYKKLFPHSYITWIEGNIEKIAIFSRHSFHVQQISGRVDQNAHLRLIFPSLGLTVYTYHGFTPINERWQKERNREIARIANELKRMHSPGVLTGDFNQTPYATHFQNALKEGELRLAPFPEGIRPTWPDTLFTAPLEIPLDHMLINDNVRVCAREVINIPGSDHSAVMNVLQLLPEVPDFSKEPAGNMPPRMILRTSRAS